RSIQHLVRDRDAVVLRDPARDAAQPGLRAIPCAAFRLRFDRHRTAEGEDRSRDVDAHEPEHRALAPRDRARRRERLLAELRAVQRHQYRTDQLAPRALHAPPASHKGCRTFASPVASHESIKHLPRTTDNSGTHEEGMFSTLALALGVASAPALASGGAPAEPDLSPGVSWELARHRASTISDLRYDLRLSIPEGRTEPIHGRVRIRLRLGDATSPLVLDFRQPPDRIGAVRVGEHAVDYDVVNGHIVVPPSVLRQGENHLEIEFVAGDEPLNRSDDFLYALFVPDRASQAFPSFDQPNLKA